MDDALTERFAKCLLCLGPTYSLDAFVIGGVVMALSRCRKCCREDPQGTRVLEQFAHREGQSAASAPKMAP